MFEVGFTEIVLILGIALLVLGPERLPRLAADIGRWAGRARSMARQLRTQLEQEATYDPLRDAPRPAATTPPPSPPPATATATATATEPPPPPAPDGTGAAAPDETDAPKSP
jgi:Tat protein translocase TatB subunit